MTGGTVTFGAGYAAAATALSGGTALFNADTTVPALNMSNQTIGSPGGAWAEPAPSR